MVNDRVVNAFRYADDLLILLNLKNPVDLDMVSCDIYNSLKACSKTSNFSKELASQDAIRFLDLKS